MIFTKGEFVWLSSGNSGIIKTVLSLEDKNPFVVCYFSGNQKRFKRCGQDELSLVEGWDLEHEKRRFFKLFDLTEE